MRTVLLSLFVFASVTLFAQYDLQKPYVGSSTCPNIKIEELHVYPDKITVDFVFEADSKASGYRYSTSSYVEFEEFGTTNYVKDVKNVDHNNFAFLKIGKKVNFSATFPFSFYEMVVSQSTSSLRSKINKFPLLKMNVNNCSETFFKNNPSVDPSTCFNFYGVELDLKPDQVEALYLCGLLDDELVKDEFETTAAYNLRTSPDSLTFLLKGVISDLELIYKQKQINRMAQITPVINYNADKEMFTMEYPNCDPYYVKVPIAQAPAFKKAIQSGTSTIGSALIVRKPDNSYYIKQIRFTDKTDKKEQTIQNVTDEDVLKYYDDTVKRVLTELKKIYSKGQIWK